MIRTLFPAVIDNSYQGSKLSLWLLGLVVALKMTQSVAVGFDAYGILEAADGIPLHAYPAAAAATIVALFIGRALSRVIVSAMAIVVLVRYRRAVPLAFMLLIVSYLADALAFHVGPLVRTGTPPEAIVSFAAFGMMAIGLTLSLMNRGSVLSGVQ